MIKTAWIPDLSKGLTGDQSDFDAAWPADGTGMTIVDDPILGSTRKVIKMVCLDSYVSPMTPTENPRLQLEGPGIINNGDEFWTGMSVLIPTDKNLYPVLPADGWLGFQGIWGAPYQGSSPWRWLTLPMNDGTSENRMTIDRNATYNWDKPWQMRPVLRGRWIDMVWHGVHSNSTVVAPDGSMEGFYEIYVNIGDGNGLVQQTLNNGQKRIYMQTRADGQNGGPNHMSVTSYRLKGMFASATHWVGGIALGRSMDEVNPRSYG